MDEKEEGWILDNDNDERRNREREEDDVIR